MLGIELLIVLCINWIRVLFNLLMSLFEVLLTLFIGIVILVSAGMFLVAIVMAKFNKLLGELRGIYGAEVEIKKRIEQYVSKVARDEMRLLVDNYRQVLGDSSKDISESLKDIGEAQVTTLGSHIREQQELITKQSGFIVGELTKKAQQDIEDYKRLQFDGVDLQVNDLVERISREVLGKAIPRQDQERLIWNAVEKAKAQGIFKEGFIKVKDLDRKAAGLKSPIIKKNE